MDNELIHYGVPGMRWRNRKGVYKNADDAYRQKQLRKVEDFHNKNYRYGPFLLKKREGVNSLQKKLYSQSNKYDKNVVAQQLHVREAIKNYEKMKVKKLTHDDIQREKMAVGKSLVTDLALTVGVTALAYPTAGIGYARFTPPQAVRSQERLRGVTYDDIFKKGKRK